MIVKILASSLWSFCMYYILLFSIEPEFASLCELEKNVIHGD